MREPMKLGLWLIGLALLFPAIVWAFEGSESPILQRITEISFLLLYFLSFALGGMGLLISVFATLGRLLKCFVTADR